MWLNTELDNGYGLLSSYECVGLEDSASVFQPTFMQQRLKWPPDEFRASLQNGSYDDGDVVSLTNAPENEFYAHGASLSKTNSSATYCRQDSSGTDSSVSPLDNTSERCSEMGENEAGMPPPAHLTQHSLHRSHDVCAALPDVCLFPDSVLSCLDDTPSCCDDAFFNSFNVPPASQMPNEKTVLVMQDVKCNVGWMKEEEQERKNVRFIKKEQSLCPPITSCYSGLERPWMNRCCVFATSTCCPSNTLMPTTGQHYRVSMHPNMATVGMVQPASNIPIPPRKLTAEQNLIRKAKVARYLEKRKKRTWGHKIRYASRKAYAENRPRIKGRFAKQEEVDALKKQTKSKTEEI